MPDVPLRRLAATCNDLALPAGGDSLGRTCSCDVGYLPRVSCPDLVTGEITIAFTGHVVETEQTILLGIGPGDLFFGTYVFATDLADTVPGDSALGFYFSTTANSGLTVTIADIEFGGSGNLEMRVANDASEYGLTSYDQYWVSPGTFEPEPTTSYEIQLSFIDRSATALSSDALWTLAPDLDAWDQDPPWTGSSFYLAGNFDGLPASVIGVIDSITPLCPTAYPGDGVRCHKNEAPCGLLQAPCPDGFVCDPDAAVGTSYSAFCVSEAGDEVYVPAGTFWMGCNAALDDGCLTEEGPQHEVTLSAFSIDRHEVTAAEYKACVLAGECSTPPSFDLGTYNVNGRESHPVNYISWSRAKAYCTWSAKAAGTQRLCTEAEWERSARGGCETVAGDCKTGMRTRPWGEAVSTPSRANFDRNVGMTTAVGTQSPAGDSPYGAQDMAGNVLEWVNDWYGGADYPETPVTNPTGPASANYRVWRGGGWSSGDEWLRASARGRSTPTDAEAPYGFRCCRYLP